MPVVPITRTTQNLDSNNFYIQAWDVERTYVETVCEQI